MKRLFVLVSALMFALFVVAGPAAAQSALPPPDTQVRSSTGGGAAAPTTSVRSTGATTADTSVADVSAAQPGALAQTGFELADAAALAGILIVGGGVVVLTTRRRSQTA